MVETEDIVIAPSSSGWSNAPLTPIAVGLVGSRPSQRRVVAILLLLAALTFGGTVVAAETTLLLAL